MDNFFTSLRKFLSVWWIRIIIFLVILIGLFFIESFFIDSLNNDLVVVFNLLFTSIITDLFRPHSTWYIIGIRIDFFFIRDVIFGFLICIFTFGLIILTGLIIGLRLDYNEKLVMAVFWDSSLLLFFRAASEELFFRGIIFQSFIERFNPFIVVIISSVFFSANHAFNPNISLIAMINIFLANILMSLMYLKTRSLWLPITFHFGWNWFQSALIGSHISGFNMGVKILDLGLINVSPSLQWILGGSFGIEEGVLSTLILIGLLPVVAKYGKANPKITSILFKRKYAESAILFKD